MRDNREEIKSLPLIWQNLMRHFALDLESAIPAVVISYDREKNLVTCRPAINRVTVEDESVERAEITVNCLNPCGNGIGINFPLREGDTGWIIAADRDTQNFTDTLAPCNPASGVLHRYAFGFFIPDKIKDFVIDAEDADALVIQTLDGKTRISVKEQQISIVSENGVKVNAVTAHVNAVTSATVICPEIAITGSITVTGDITASGDVVGNGISLASHTHYDPAEEANMTGKPFRG